MLTDSAEQTASVTRTLVTLPAPTIDPPTSYRSVDLPISIYKGASGVHPSGYRIYYATDGSDPGNSGGNPVTGVAYSGAFHWGLGECRHRAGAHVCLATYAAWFNPSALSTATYTSAEAETISWARS